VGTDAIGKSGVEREREVHQLVHSRLDLEGIHRAAQRGALKGVKADVHSNVHHVAFGMTTEEMGEHSGYLLVAWRASAIAFTLIAKARG